MGREGRGERVRSRARKVLVSMRVPTSAIRPPLQTVFLFLSLWGCNDILGFQEGKPYPEGGTHADSSVVDVADGSNPIDENSEATIADAHDANADHIDAGDA